MGTFPTLQYATKTATARDGKVKHAAISASTRKSSGSSRRLWFLLGLIAAFNLGGLPFVVVVEAAASPIPAPTKRPVPAQRTNPNPNPTRRPIPAPTKLPIPAPTKLPIPAPTPWPTPLPTISPRPTALPTFLPTLAPSYAPSATPSLSPSATPSILPTAQPTLEPSPLPTPTCLEGTYQTIGEETEGEGCRNCTAGKYQDQRGQLSCLTCDEGKFSGPGSRNCTICPPGKFNEDEALNHTEHANVTSCKNCKPGYFSAADGTRCHACKPGQFIKDQICHNCTIGRYAARPMNDDCLICGKGYFTNRPSRATACSACGAGTYSEALSVTCTLCRAGTYSTTSSFECRKCSLGFFTNATGSAACTACQAGFFAGFDGSSKCDACPEGFFSGASGQGACESCSKGKYQDRRGQMSCNECGGGTYQSSTASTSCEPCPVGHFASSTKSSKCDVCPENSISPDSGTVSCSVCSYPTRTNGTNRANCSACAFGYYWDDSSLAEPCMSTNTGPNCCRRCPRGTECGAAQTETKHRYAGNLIVNEKYFRFSETSTKIYRCGRHHNYAQHCGGGDIPGDASCRYHSHGPLCRQCKVGYFHGTVDGTCIRCAKGAILLTTLPIIGLVVFVFLIYAIYRNVPACSNVLRRLWAWSKTKGWAQIS